jgi:hypothetical protein
MKRAALLVLLAVIVAACSSTNYKTADGRLVHWQQNRAGSLERQVTVIVPAQYASDGSFMSAVNVGIQQVNRSPYLNYVLHVPNVAPTSCPNHCILVTRAALAYPVIGSTSTGWNSAGHMYGMASKVRISTVAMTQNVKNNLLCHELFHTAGLGHGDTQGPCVNAIATDWDLALVRNAHIHADPIYVGSSASLAGLPDKVTETRVKDIQFALAG